MFVLKLFLVPVFLWAITLAGRRWGASVAGWLAGFPVVAGPILFLLAVEHGLEFAQQAALFSLAAVFASLTFNLAYAWSCRRAHWSVALAIAYLAWLGAAGMVHALQLSLLIAAIIAIGALSIAPFLFPRANQTPSLIATSRFDLPLRMIAGAVLVVTVTGVAKNLGAEWSGLLSVFPVLGSVLAVFTHKASGPTRVTVTLVAMSRGLWSFAVFCFLLTAALANLGPIAFGLAAGTALIAQIGVRYRLQSLRDIAARQ